MTRFLLPLALLLALVPASTLAAQASAPNADAQAEVRAVIDRMFDGMRAGDSAQVRSVFHPTARLQSVGVREGQPMLRTDAIDGFVAAVGQPHDVVWDERISDLVIQVDGPFATAWMNYTFYAGDTLSHCGINAFHLFRSAEGWKVTQITDTRRREGCPALPKKG